MGFLPKPTCGPACKRKPAASLAECDLQGAKGGDESQAPRPKQGHSSPNRVWGGNPKKVCQSCSLHISPSLLSGERAEHSADCCMHSCQRDWHSSLCGKSY